ncbi:MAG: hypothetical protein H6595_08550 [Flavobacteriales bacterium]|nr:hypothetical protein [Flavobacteriales bacterium]MCB9167516.1 hypothetical protein [Flavobacteriales bacterium]
MKAWTITGAWILAGALAGLAWWHYVGCENGCLITSVWWRSMLYGGVMGYFTGGMLVPRRGTEDTNDDHGTDRS